MISLSKAEGLWLELSSAVESAMDVGTGDTATMRYAQRLLELIHQGLQQQQGAPIKLHMCESLFVHSGIPLADASIRGRATIAFLRFTESGGIEFTKDIDLPSIVELVDLARGVCKGEDHAFGERRNARLAQLRGIALLEPNDNITWEWIDEGPAGEAYESAGFSLESAAPARQDVASAVEEAMGQAGAGQAVQMDTARTVSESIVAVGQTGFDNLMQLAERPEFDVFTVQHSLRVSLLATYVASQHGASKELMTELGAAAMFHDVGKGRIPEEILYKPGRLDDDERRVISTHPQLGTEILLESPSVSACALGAAWGHHLRHDGKGYPERRPWFEVTQATSLIQVCDVFEALTARRPYKAPYSPARAFQILYSDAGAYDPAVLSAFTRAMGLFPPGRFVLLSNGYLGRVARAGKSLDRPLIKVFPEGQLMDLSEPANAGVAVAKLLQEPEFVQLLMSSKDGVVSTEQATGLEPLAPLPSSTQPDSEEASRDEEFAEAPVQEGGGCSEDHDHGDDCRLC
jgi:HD-GYP domain-containing protein (c-di-GMP phosphodiesterase class II)